MADSEMVERAKDGRAQRRKAVIRECVTWLHDEARRMNDPHARDILNSAALRLGVTLGRAALAPNPPADERGHDVGDANGKAC